MTLNWIKVQTRAQQPLQTKRAILNPTSTKKICLVLPNITKLPNKGTANESLEYK